ncbi:uncharacterized protein MYCFIDRAFT_83052 [Pseudocercospora fijiensis CIRAD86]|uniref:Uncharacterized protein n=1 Tax=Pseudocercospora fijiensis (strain CIRAD86) TaxID=383855 RepID=M2Z5B5_PSEFD|nr:uncharacterized protein MYCFIDRAFT_83052 [Pseudocercospora fijiensis CIRAD86]EME85005.1 hypothetical protein MYCFIDRAFT_83052 [Pseudocercospora fijiensis CIRAD86]
MYPAPFETHILGPQSCFIGQNDKSPPCDSLTEEQVASIGAAEQRWNNSDIEHGLPSRNCTDSWDMTVHPNFIGSDDKPSIHFHPSKHLVVCSIQVFLNLNFTFNTNQSNWDFNYVSGPDLWMLVYDGNAMDAATAYTTGNGEYTLVNVDSTTTVTMDPVYIQYRNGTATYQYHVTLNRTPNV